MPLSISVGLARKASRDYQSSGVSIDVTAELDQALLARPEELQQQIEQLYSQAQVALERRAALCPPVHDSPGAPAVPAATAPSVSGAQPARQSATREGRASSNSNDWMMTPNQRRAIYAIAQRLGVDAEQEVRDVFGCDLGQLSLKQASQVIDHLQGLQVAGNGH